VLGSLKRLFEERLAPGATQPSPQGREHDLRLAAAALLFEVVRADGAVEAEELVRLAEEASRGAASLYEFTALVDRELPFDDKKRLVELLWLVAFADAAKDAQEEHIVRQVASLLHVPHPDFIDAKIRARAQSGLDKG
jgi:uncharacterized tellurite resistance protein B-like protein